MDRDWYLRINDFADRTPWLHWLIPPYALWGGLAALTMLLLIGWLWARRQSEAIDKVSIVMVTALSTVVAVIINQHVISPSVARIRPCHVIADAHTLLPCTTDFSMPSDHCIIAGAFAAGLWTLSRKFGILATVLALALAFGRVYSGVHYPSDVMVGLVAGAAINVILVRCLRGLVAHAFRSLPRSTGAVFAGPDH